MAVSITHRQALTALLPLDGGRRMRGLSSIKNRQNSGIPKPTNSVPVKSSQNSPSKRRLAPADLEPEAENAVPASPTKRSKALDGSPKRASSTIALAAPVPAPSFDGKRSTISTSRGSPKHKRSGILSKRTASRINPPNFKASSDTALSIDAALSGSVANNEPSSETTSAPKPCLKETSALDEKCMPKAWFFDIYEDSPETEAANLMEHSAQVLDISSDDESDDDETKDRNAEGKENVPPPDYFSALISRSSTPTGREKAEARRKLEDGMEEDRQPLGDLRVEDYHDVELDANSNDDDDDGNAIADPSLLSAVPTFVDNTPKKKIATSRLSKGPASAIVNGRDASISQSPLSEESAEVSAKA